MTCRLCSDDGGPNGCGNKTCSMHVSRPTQLDRFVELSRRLVRLLSDGVSLDDAPTRELLVAMDRVHGEAQNSPPLGVSDGSFNAHSFMVAHDLLTACRDLRSVEKRLLCHYRDLLVEQERRKAAP